MTRYVFLFIISLSIHGELCIYNKKVMQKTVLERLRAYSNQKAGKVKVRRRLTF